MEYGASSLLRPSNLAPLPLRVCLGNGVRVLILETTSPVVSLELFFWGGIRLETPTQAGISHLIAAMLTRGTPTRSAAEIGELIESCGASLETEAEADYFAVRLKALGEDMEILLPLVAHLCQDSTFPKTELDHVKADTLYALAEQGERPLQQSYQKLQPALYGEHPYALPSIGTVTTVTNLHAEELQTHVKRFFCPQWVTIAITGSMSTQKMLSLVENSFGGWQAKETDAQPKVSPAHFKPSLEQIEVPGQQAWLLLGYPAPSVHDRDYFACKLLNAHLGNGSSSRLFVELRENQGLVYDASSFFPTRLDRSQFMVYLSTSPEVLPAAHQALRRECDRLREELLTPEALQLAKNKLIGHYAMGKQTPAQVAHVLAWYSVLGLPPDFDANFADRVQALTAQDLLETAQRYCQAPAIAIVSGQERLDPQT